VGQSRPRRKLALLVEYEGTRYCGFQVQPGQPTVQGELERAIACLTGERVQVRGASRTDSGVHARGQVVSFESLTSLPVATIVSGLNHYLPPDVAVWGAAEVGGEFDPRRSARQRHYQYMIVNSPQRSPRWRRWAWLVRRPLDLGAMRVASQALLGEHDFSAFSSADLRGRSPIRTISRAEVNRCGGLVIIDMVGNSFLPHQLRHTVGALVEVGLGKRDVVNFVHLVGGGGERWRGQAAPAHGLCLKGVDYGEDEPLWEFVDEDVQR